MWGRESGMAWLEWGRIINSCNSSNSRLQLRKTRQGWPCWTLTFAGHRERLRGRIPDAKVSLPSPSWRQGLPVLAFNRLVLQTTGIQNELSHAGGNRMHHLGVWVFCLSCRAQWFCSPTVMSCCQVLPMLRGSHHPHLCFKVRDWDREVPCLDLMIQYPTRNGYSVKDGYN